MKLRVIIIAAFALFSLASCGKKENPAAIAKAKADSMETNYKAFMAAWDAGKVDEFDKYVVANCLENYQPLPGMKSGLDGLKEMATLVHTAIPDNKTTLSNMYTQGDTLNLNYTDTGMNTGPLNGMPPSNEKMTGAGNYHVRWQNGKFIELSDLMDVRFFGVVRFLRPQIFLIGNSFTAPPKFILQKGRR